MIRMLSAADKLAEIKNLYYQTSRGSWGSFFGLPIATNYTNVQTNIPEVQEKMNKVVADDEKMRAQLWGEIDSLASRTKADLTQKYKGF